MATWAIVIGIDQYWTPEASLRGAVRDALRMREWLLSVDGGAVPSANLQLLLGPSQASAAAPPGARPLEATQEHIIRAIDRVMQRSGGQGERLFFYYAGHGLSSALAGGLENAMVPADFTDLLTTRSLGLRSIFEFFKAARFQEQFFFVDACRNIPWLVPSERKFRIGEWPLPATPNFDAPPPQQFICYATSQGLRAVELQEAGNERGAFTEALLNGLRGAGPAKTWDADSEQYVVRWQTLFKYVEDAITRQQLDVGETARKLIQVPRQDGEKGSSDPVLVRFAAETFPAESLSVYVDPPEVPAGAELLVTDFGDIEQTTPVTAVPLQLALPPREYQVRANVPDYETDPKRGRVALYGPDQLTLKLRRKRPMRGIAPPAPPPPAARGLDAAPQLCRLTVTSGDPLAALEIADSSGKVLETGIGRLDLMDLKPGFYRARLHTPEGAQVEELVDLEAGETEERELRAPAPAETGVMRELMARGTVFSDAEDNLHVSEALGPIASLQLSTVLTLAGNVANKNTPWGHRLRALGVDSFQAQVPPGTEQGVQILFGGEFGTPEQIEQFVARVELRLWPQDQPLPAAPEYPRLVPATPGLAQIAWARSPGAHWLALGGADQAPVVFPLTVLAGRLALLVIHQDAAGQTHIFQYLPALGADDVEPVAPNEAPDVAQAKLLRRLELLQRFYMSGRLDHAHDAARELLYAKWREPIAGCLGGYLMLRLDKPAELNIAAANMRNYFGELSDSHVLMAEYAGRVLRDDTWARQEFAAALERGLPLFADGAARLLEGVKRYGIDHPRVATLQTVVVRRVPGLLWAGWRPRELAPGQMLGL